MPYATVMRINRKKSSPSNWDANPGNSLGLADVCGSCKAGHTVDVWLGKEAAEHSE